MPETTVVSAPPDLTGSVERIVLIGFMGAGKSTVGPLLARALGWRFVDLDAEVERAEGSSVAELIRGRGVERFRELESRTGRRVLRRRRVVVAAGGGWAAEPGHMDLLYDRSLVAWPPYIHVQPPARTRPARLWRRRRTVGYAPEASRARIRASTVRNA